MDFFTVPTFRFQVLYVFLVLAHDRRRIVHFNVTAHPTAEWTAQQLREAFPFDQVPRYLLRDRDGIFGREFRKGRESDGNPGGALSSAIAMAACLRGTGDWLNSARMFGPHNRVRGSFAVPACAEIPGLLS